VTAWAWFFAGCAGVLCVLLILAIHMWGRTLEIAQRLLAERQQGEDAP
jgi:hypothetical protein